MQRPILALSRVAACSLLWLIGCQPTSPIASGSTPVLRTESTEFAVQAIGYFYRTTIPFTYTNETGDVVSKQGCGGPELPIMEKKVGDRWVVAYNAIYNDCLTIPDFAVETGATYQGVLYVDVSQPGHNSGPELRVDSIEGTYRLTWDLSSGRKAGAKGSRIVSSTSMSSV